MWTFIALAPDGRELARETGGREAEARVGGAVERFNRDVPRGGKLAVVRMVPSYASGNAVEPQRESTAVRP